LSDIRRLNWGCGSSPAPGWLNSDRRSHNGVDVVADVREGLPLDAESIDYVFSMHALQEVPFDSVVSVLGELRRVLRRDGWLRLCLPDVDKAIDAYRRRDAGHFRIPDEDASTLGGKFVVHMLWYGHSRLLFTRDFAEELLLRAGFREVHQVVFGETASPWPEIVELDDREWESLYVEALK
jgi:predicted SAM-dependent methyltransferase